MKQNTFLIHMKQNSFFFSGLMFEPFIDDIPFIKYSVGDMKTYSKYLDQLQYYVYGKTILCYYTMCIELCSEVRTCRHICVYCLGAIIKDKHIFVCKKWNIILGELHVSRFIWTCFFSSVWIQCINWLIGCLMSSEQ